MYLNSSDLPPEYLNRIPKEYLPFVDKEAFRILYLMKRGEGVVVGVVVDQDKTIQRIELAL